MADFTLSPAKDADFERLLELKNTVQRPHLQRVGRLEPQRSRDKFRAGFELSEMRLIHVEGAFAGCIGLTRAEGVVEVENFYIAQEFQGNGLGGAVMRAVMDEAREDGVQLKLTVLVDSPANRFSQRVGFVEVGRTEIDVFYELRI